MSGLFGAPHPAGRACARCLALLDSNLSRRFSSFSPDNYDGFGFLGQKGSIFVMVVGEGLFGALRLTLRAALARVVSRCSTRTLIEGSHPSPRRR